MLRRGGRHHGNLIFMAKNTPAKICMEDVVPFTARILVQRFLQCDPRIVECDYRCGRN